MESIAEEHEKQDLAEEDELHEQEEAVEADEVREGMYEPTEQEKKDLEIARDKNGHLGRTEFARLLRFGRCRTEIVRWVQRRFVCDDCEANKRLADQAQSPSRIALTT